MSSIDSDIVKLFERMRKPRPKIDHRGSEVVLEDGIAYVLDKKGNVVCIIPAEAWYELANGDHE